MKDIHWAIEHHRCRVNEEVERFASTRLVPGDKVFFSIQRRPSIQKESSRILFEDEEMVAYNKPSGISSPDLATLLGLELVHRLDRDTTGVILFAKTAEGRQKLEALFRTREVEKSYLAIVEGNLSTSSGTICAPLAPIHRREGSVRMGVDKKGKFAKTDWEVLLRRGSLSLLRCSPKTGRTHQIRAHLRHLGLPIVGDREYGHKGLRFLRPMLHAESVVVKGREILAPIPADWPPSLTIRFSQQVNSDGFSPSAS